MKHVVEYKLHDDQTPYFIADGGYFFNNWKLIGVTKDDVKCYVPPVHELVTFTDLESFIAHITTLPLVHEDCSSLTEQEKIAVATDWWNKHV